MTQKQRRKGKKTSVFLHIFRSLLVVVVLQAVILYAVLTVRGVFVNLNNNSLRLLEESTKNKQQVLLTSMINDWSNLLTTEEAINDLVEQELSAQGKDWADIKTDPELNRGIVIRTADELIRRLRLCKTTGIYMVLDGIAVADQADSYAGFYVRDADPYSNTNDRSDLLMLRGLPAVSREENLSLHSFWMPTFTFEGGAENPDNRFFYNPLLSAQSEGVTSSEYFGYWSPNFVFGDSSDQEVIMYSIPLMNEEGLVYGVLGVEINQAFLTKTISNERYGDRERCFYYLGVTEGDSLSYRRICSSGDRFGLSDITASKDRITGDGQYIRVTDRQGTVIYGDTEELKLYNSNTPFETEQWVLIGMQDKSTLFETSAQAQRIIIYSLLLSMALGSLISAVAGRSVVKPIRNLLNAIRNGGDNQSLPHAGVSEIDTLAEAIELRNREILDSAKRTSTLIELSGLPVGVYEIREQIGKVYCSKGFLSLLNCEGACKDEEHITLQELQDILSRVQENPFEEDIYKLVRDGSVRYIRLVNQTDAEGVIGAVLDVTDEVRNRKRIERERDFDALTGIWNRRTFENHMDDLFANHTDELRCGALLMLDLDNLKFINDAYGHDCGDDYIRAFAKSLLGCLTPHTLLARRSGDEFYLFTYGYEETDGVDREIQRIWKHLSESSIELPDHTEFRLRFSGGVSRYPEHSTLPNTLIHYADFAMYQVKHSQKGSLQLFNAEKYHADSFLFNGQEALNRLIDRRLIHFAFQPIIAVKTGEVYGYEFLMRGEVEELQTPDVILRLAKSQGKLQHIEKITWECAMETAGRLREQSLISENAWIFVNSIADQTLPFSEEEEFRSRYRDVLPHIVLEVTEGEGNNMDYTRRKLSFIRTHGGQVAIDDFGTGYNSELALVMIPADIVKIDMSLVRDVNTNPDKQILIQNLISYARQRSIAVLAEGVETQEEMRTLVSFGVDYLQGYYLGLPKDTPVRAIPEKIRADLLAMQNS